MTIKEQIIERYNKAVATAKEMNEKAKATREEIIKDVQKESQPWRKLADKAIKGGKELAGKQKEMLASTSDDVKKQWAESTERFKKIVKA